MSNAAEFGKNIMIVECLHCMYTLYNTTVNSIWKIRYKRLDQGREMKQMMKEIKCPHL